MSDWRDEQNRRARARLDKALPKVFPANVLNHALARRFIPPMPRLAVDSYWRNHPVRAERLARALAAETGAPSGWTWRLGSNPKLGLPATFRAPPAPYRERKFARGPGFCCVCGQPVFRFGWHRDLWEAGPNSNAIWHAACVIEEAARLAASYQGQVWGLDCPVKCCSMWSSSAPEFVESSCR